KKVLIIVSLDENPIIEFTPKLRPDILHICGNEFRCTKELADNLRSICPGIEIMQAVGLPNENALEEAIHFASFCDYLILDTINPAITSIGVAGKTHSWEDDKRIVEAVSPTKVIIAGGLGPDNIYDAIKAVRPYGVDSFTKTSNKINGVLQGKDKEKILSFVKEAKRAYQEIAKK
ncbi:MAG: phosphoribosylanthranilate isomerase, partial [Bacilli bacterium]|nr:phosphoribosylanthranilate isomerase [Bacilli bacterium]